MLLNKGDRYTRYKGYMPYGQPMINMEGNL